MFGGDLDRIIGVTWLVGDGMQLYARNGVLYNAYPGFVVSDSSPYCWWENMYVGLVN